MNDEEKWAADCFGIGFEKDNKVCKGCSAKEQCENSGANKLDKVLYYMLAQENEE